MAPGTKDIAPLMSTPRLKRKRSTYLETHASGRCFREQWPHVSVRGDEICPEIAYAIVSLSWRTIFGVEEWVGVLGAGEKFNSFAQVSLNKQLVKTRYVTLDREYFNWTVQTSPNSNPIRAFPVHRCSL